MKIFLCGLVFLSTIYSQSADRLHFDSYVADTHNDVLLRVLRGDDITEWTTNGHSDIPRLLAGGMDAQVFAVWVNPSEFLPDSAFYQANKMIDALERVAAVAPEEIGIADCYADLIQLEQEGKLAAVIGVEGGHSIENSLVKLEELHARGMSYLGITWNNSTDWATSAKDESGAEELRFKGLTDFGRHVVRRCNELGVIVDVSHSGEQTFWDILEVTTNPIIASHSSVYALCPHFRNLKDDQLRAIKENGGAVFVNFYPGYIDSTFEQKAEEIRERHQAELDSLKKHYGEESDDYWYASMDVLETDIGEVAPSVDVLVDHIDYISKLIGPEHVGLGSDFDGVSVLPKGVEDCTKLPVITEKLLERGYSEEDIRKILGGNFKRVFKEVVG